MARINNNTTTLINIWGQEVQDTDYTNKLCEKFLVPPFSVLDTKQKYWQDRKRAWIRLGIKSELGRGDGLTFGLDSFKYDDDKKIQAIKKEQEHLGNASCMPKSFDENKYGKIMKASSTSIFDPVVCEVCYNWFNIKGGKIIDPFAGGSVRGIVAKQMKYEYTGIDLSLNQIEANKQNAREIFKDDWNNGLNWINDDSNNLLNYVKPESQDLVFTCPPYFNLEVYSDKQNDLSNMSWDEFKKVYRSIIEKCCKALKNNRFCIFVVGDVRDSKTGEYIGLVNYTKAVLRNAGLKEWNEIILLNSIGTATIRCAHAFNSNRKLTKIHQNILVFYKGEQSEIKNNFKEIEMDY